jgi:hypothetical protein
MMSYCLYVSVQTPSSSESEVASRRSKRSSATTKGPAASGTDHEASSSLH